VLTLKRVSAGYDDADVLSDISFTALPGDFLAILGTNGCGKTTLLRAMAGLLPYRGEVLLFERPVARMKRREIASHMAILAQSTGIYQPYSVYDTVMMGRYVHMRDRFFSEPSEEDRAVVRRYLETLDLLTLQNRSITELSGGQLQRVFLARTLAQEPHIILLDEPTNHLDLRYQLELMHYLKTWVSEGKRAVIGVLHDVNLALQFANKGLILHDGGMRSFGEMGKICTGTVLKEIYEVDVMEYMQVSLTRWQEFNQ